MSERIVIIGAGPTGLGAAWRLNELGHENWDLFEASDHVGGLSSSVVDVNGFTWDLGGHVLFSHYRYFDALMDELLGDRWVTHEREAWAWMRDRWIPYPVQNNLWRLPSDEVVDCLRGLIAAAGKRPNFKDERETFESWLLDTFGPGLCNTFMFPYNRKVWAYEPRKLNAAWVRERVATVDLDRILGNVVNRRDDVSWGPNQTFRFPLAGGTGAIWRALVDRLPEDRVHYNRRVTWIDTGKREVVFSTGHRTTYDRLITTMPMSRLLGTCDVGLPSEYTSLRFLHSSTHVIGVGLRGQPPEDLRTKCWMYFPEPTVPFYRVTVFSNYSPCNVPRPGEQWSLMAEVSASNDRPVDLDNVIKDTVRGLERCGLIDAGNVTNTFHRRLEYGYPTPWLRRDEVIEGVQRRMRDHEIYSRGRFGAWKYEVSNQDHSLMQGVEVVNHLLLGADEPTVRGEMSDSDLAHW